MAHLIDETKGKGFYSFQQPAWHGLGYVSDVEVKNVDEILTLAGLDFEVFEHFPCYTATLDDGTQKEFCSEHKILYRSDTGAELAVQKPSYEVFQNKEGFAIVDDLIQSGKVTVHTAGSLRGGKQMFTVLKHNNPIKLNNNDLINNYFCILNSHDSSLAIVAMVTPVRIVCNNTMSFALGNYKTKVSIKHTKNARSRVVEATKILTTVKQASEELEVNAKQLQKMSFTDKMRRDFFLNVFLTKKEISDFKTGKAMFSTRKANILTNIEDYCFIGQGQKEAGNGTAWQALNAVTGYLNHADTLGYRSERDANAKFTSLIGGTDANTMQLAGKLALQPESIIPVVENDEFFNFSFN